MLLTPLVSSLQAIAGKRLLHKRNTGLNYLTVCDNILRMT
jgi:hypothetical protein